MDCNVNIMMFGGRRCGKTSVISAMKDCFSQVFGKSTHLEIRIEDEDTMDMLREKKQEIEQYFANKNRSITFNCDGTDDIVDYKMIVSIAEKKGSMINFSFCDFPGEWLIKYPGREEEWKRHQAQLSSKMKKCDIIIIAVDSIYLMEKAMTRKGDSVGQFNEGRNYCSVIANMVKNNFSVLENGNPKMIMFVPLKCETYFDQGQMQLLNQRIHTGYQELFDYLQKKENRNHYQVIIAPILTLGENTVRFSRFEYKKEGQKDDQIEVDSVTKIPSIVKFLFKDMNANYHPEFCEQPLLYTLAYLLDLMNKMKEREKQDSGFITNWIRGLKEKYGNLASAENFLAEKELIQKQLKKSNDGYELVNNPLRF